MMLSGVDLLHCRVDMQQTAPPTTPPQRPTHIVLRPTYVFFQLAYFFLGYLSMASGFHFQHSCFHDFMLPILSLHYMRAYI